jgi:two-component system, cell cycle response regulator DivK
MRRSESQAGAHRIVERPSVLIVEDFDDAREMYAAYLRYLGFRVFEARDGLEAVSAAAGLRPDLIVMDLALPRLDGWAAAARIRADPDTCHTRIIALTAYSDQESHRRALEAGCLMVCPKPCDPDELVGVIGAVLGNAGVSTRSAASAVAGHGPVPESSS